MENLSLKETVQENVYEDPGAMFIDYFSCIDGSIFSDFGRSDEFLLDGDALVLHTAMELFQVYECKGNSTSESLLLHQNLLFIDAFESFLYKLVSRKCKFTLLFLSKNSKFYKSKPLLFLRTLIVEHYKSLLNDSMKVKVIDIDWFDISNNYKLFLEVSSFYKQNLFSFMITLPPNAYQTYDKLYNMNYQILFTYLSTGYFAHFVDINESKFRGSSLFSFIYSFQGRRTIDVDFLEFVRETIEYENEEKEEIKKEIDFTFIENYQHLNNRDLIIISSILEELKSPKSLLLKNENSIIKELCIYLVLVEDLPFQERSFDLLNVGDQGLLGKFDVYLNSISIISNHSIQFIEKVKELKGNSFDIDIIDAKFLIFINLLMHDHKNDIKSFLEDDQIIRVNHMITMIDQLSGLDLSMNMSKITPILSGTYCQKVLLSIRKNTEYNNKIEFPMYKVKCDFVDKIVGDVQSQLDFNKNPPTEILNHQNQPEYYAVNHTHVLDLLKSLPDAFQTKLKEDYVVRKKFSEKAKQGAAAKYFRNSESLFDPSKKTLISEISDDSNNNNGKKEKVNYQKNKQSMPKNQQLKKKDAIQEKLDNKLKEKTEFLHKQIRKQTDSISMIEILLVEINKSNEPEFIKEYTKAIERIGRKYDNLPQERIKLYQLIQKILRLFDEQFFVQLAKDKNMIKFIESIYQASTLLSLNDLSNYINSRFKLEKIDLDLSDEQDQSSVIFQMEHSHDTLVRSTNSAKDHRVKHFLPDLWQRELLDIVDRNESALICAPTSSGKTFISFYAFEKVLRSSNDGVVVYVSPTKALVNQMYAEVIGRYEKNYANIVGNNCAAKYRMAGIFTRDYRIDYDRCQVLITVPQCLDLLFLSITNSDWLHKVKYVIFDEVHQISNGVDGAIWEQLLLMNPAPFLALSATLGNLTEFYKWLQEIDPKRKVNLIETKNRFNDLKLYQYNHNLINSKLKKKDILQDEEEEEEELNTVIPHHPFKTLKVKKNSDELTLLSEESLELYNIMIKRFGSDDEINYLNPITYFSKTKQKEYNLQKEQLTEYQKLLKQVFQKRISTPEAEEIIFQDFPDTRISVGHDWKKKIPMIIEDLKKKNLLPVIVFFFERRGCEKLALKVKKAIDKKNFDPKLEEKIKILKTKIAKLEEEIKATKPTSDDEIHTEVEKLYSKIAFLTSRKPEYGTIMKDDIINNKNKLDNHFLMGVLMEGVGVHHSGLSKEYLENVEILYRKKKIQVCFATGTLALGINLPCRTVIIAGDSPYNNPLMYRQMAGRSGRRGFENRGHVIFLGMPENRVNSLVNSKLSQIVGNSVLSPSLVLRLFCRFNFIQFEDKEKQEEFSQTLINCTRKVVEKSFFLTNSPLQNQLLFLFSTDYIYRFGYLNRSGQAIGYSGIIIHLSYLEPYNFIIVELLRSGIFDKYTKDNKYDEIEILKILAYLFNREFLPNILPKASSSLISLGESLPKELEHIIKSNNMSLIKTLVPYLISLQSLSPDQDIMPISKNINKILKKDPLPTAGKWNSQVSKPYIEKGRLIKGIKSLSGSCNTINNTKKLEFNLPSGSFLDLHVLPIVLHEPKKTNSYLVDLYKHKQRSTIYEDNRISEGRLFTNLKDFNMTLRTISNSLVLQSPGSPVTLAFQRLSSKYLGLYNQFYVK